ncbi:malate synthase G [Agrobacterium bohemicum]|uniref:Malate synthase G n=1 Tax=Agrobacterium bohemicum TaxID=2052828 RepID=A0A135NY11_9HYPH|nr:malate synthase G [Agrobacterium bohemicum]KXG84047.1 malate synthase G [Agrobacterium bohemicum]
MTNYIAIGSLRVEKTLHDFVANEVAPGTGVDINKFWSGYQAILTTLEPENKRLLAERDEFQKKIDAWIKDRGTERFDVLEQRRFLEEIGYIVPQQGDFSIETANIDAEIASLAGPQLVVPVMNARFALNAANARWGSLYDALYGTDAIDRSGELAPGSAYNELRGKAVIAKAASFLDIAIPLRMGSHANATRYMLNGTDTTGLLVGLADGSVTELADPSQLVGFTEGNNYSILFRNNGLHIELLIDRNHPLGKTHAAGVRDVLMESALTTIQDCEDSVAAVDAEDKVVVYRNWLRLMQGSLTDTFEKNGQEMTRRLGSDKRFKAVDGSDIILPGRSLMLVRNVGHLMTTDAVTHADGSVTPEGFLDAMITTFAAMHDLGTGRNSRTGSIYVVKPKMHGPAEAMLTNRLFDSVEKVLGLPHNTVKIGVMDEERRTSVNLQETIRSVKGRIAFINTGFLDRTGDEIHTSMQAGPVAPKNEIKSTVWLPAYENNNVDVGLRVGMGGKAQIGKGMWSKPDAMQEMLDVKIGHPKSGASTAWVPSPTAAVLHATHYHQVKVTALQDTLRHRQPASLNDLLTPPLLEDRNLPEEDVRRELDNNAQSILGYVVRWIDQGIGCSKVPDLDNIALMEDRATLRISSQHIANWLEHGLCSEQQVEDTFRRMAAVVDEQNASDPNYSPMTRDLGNNIAFQAARDLVFRGTHQPNGYTEPVLHRRRREAKARLDI